MSNLWEFMWQNLPPGFRFHPTDEEFVNHYLTNYIHGIKDNVNVIPIVDDLFKRDPSELPGLFKGSSIIKSKDPEWWFLSTLRYKSLNGEKFDRSTNTGSWKITGKPKEIRHRGEDRKIAVMRNLVFCKNPRNVETNWVIHEYHLCNISLELTLPLCEQRKHVLCHLVNRQYDYTETLANMEVDLEFEEQQHEFSEEIIQAMIRSLTEGPTQPVAADNPLHKPQESCEAFMLEKNFEEMEEVMSTNNEDQDDILDLIKSHVPFSTDEESTHSDEFDVTLLYEPLEETSRVTSNHSVLKENRQAGPPGALEGYVVIDEIRGFVEDDFQREEAGDALSLTDFLGSDHQSAPFVERRHSTHPGRNHNFTEGKAKDAGIAKTEPCSSTPAVRRNSSTGSQTLPPSARNEKMPITCCEKNQAGDGSRPPFDYLVNRGVVIVLLVLMLSWLLMY